MDLNFKSLKNSKNFLDFARKIDDKLLSSKDFPNIYFDLLIQICCDEEMFSSKGFENILMLFIDDYYFDKLNTAQKTQLKEALISNIELCDHELNRHCIADILARKYDEHEMLKIFHKLADSGNPRKIHVAFVGCDIYRMGATLDSTIREEAREMMHKMDF